MIHNCSCIHIVNATVLMSHCHTVRAGSLPPDSCYYPQHLEDTVGSRAVCLIVFWLQAYRALPGISIHLCVCGHVKKLVS